MQNSISVDLLKPHEKNQEYFENVLGEKYEEIKRSIKQNGIRDPLKVLPDYTVVAGHQRLRIAKELGIEKVPVVVLDISEEEAEYLLIADNEERRQGDNDNPMLKAKRAKFLKEYWGVQKGGDRKSKGNGCPLILEEKSLKDIAEELGQSVRTTKELLKLNDLIPPLQELVAQKKLGTIAAYSLAFLTEEEQEQTLETLGETGVCGLSKAEAKELRSQLEVERKKLEEAQEEAVLLKNEVEYLKKTIGKARAEAGEEASRKANEAVIQLKQKILKLETELEEQGDEPDPELLEKVEHLTLLHEEATSELNKKEESLKIKSECYRELNERHKKANAKLKKAEEDAEKWYQTLQDYKKANSNLTETSKYKITRIRSLVNNASSFLGQHLIPIETEFKENLVGNEESFAEISDKVMSLAKQLIASGEELKTLVRGLGGETIEVSGRVIIEAEVIEAEVIDV